MTDLDKLTMLVDEHTARAVRLGYALGFGHGRQEDRDCDLDINSAAEFRALDGMGFPS